MIGITAQPIITAVAVALTVTVRNLEAWQGLIDTVSPTIAKKKVKATASYSGKK